MHPAVGPNIGYGQRTPTFTGAINRETFDVMTDHIVSKYFSQPNYLRVVSKPGAPACAFFQIYELPTFIAGQGGVQKVRPTCCTDTRAATCRLFVRAVVMFLFVCPHQCMCMSVSVAVCMCMCLCSCEDPHIVQFHSQNTHSRLQRGVGKGYV